MINEGILEKFQNCLRDFLSGMHEFRSIPIMPYNPSELESILNGALGGGVGLTIVIMPPIPEEVIVNVPGPVFRRICCEVRVVENIASNRTGSSANYVAEKVMHYLHLWHPQLSDPNDCLVLSERTPWKSDQSGNNNAISLFFEIQLRG